MPNLIKMPYGAFKGKTVDELPSGYLYWVAENFKDDRIATAADQEWQLREKQNAHWEE